METLILGGTAWLGREIAKAALAAGHDVTALARGASGRVPDGVRHVVADRAAEDAYDEVADRDWDVVVDVARQPSQVRGAVRALAGRTGAWVFVSSMSVYADHSTPGADESADLQPPHQDDDQGEESYGARKVACEQAVLDGIPDRALIARSGLITGPGDETDRTGYWPLRFAHPASADGAVLVPDSPLLTQVIDVRDLAAWLIDAAERGVTGVLNASGPVMPLAEHLAAARRAGGHDGPVVPVAQDWLVEHGVQLWSGERSLPLWLSLPEYAGLMSRDTTVAEKAGLVTRPVEESLRDTLAWELHQGPGRRRRAGLTPADEIALIEAARSGS